MAEATTQLLESHVPPPPLDIDLDLSPRIRNLRRLAVSFANELDPTERSDAEMASWYKTRSEPIVIQRAKAAAKILMTQSLVLD